MVSPANAFDFNKSDDIFSLHGPSLPGSNGPINYTQYKNGDTITYISTSRKELSKLIREIRILSSGNQNLIETLLGDFGKYFATFKYFYDYVTHTVTIATYNRIAAELEYYYREGVYSITLIVNGRNFQIIKN